MTADSGTVRLANIAAQAALDKKATDVVALDVSGVLVITDIFLLCSGSNPRHTAAIVDEVERKVRAAGGPAARREGERDASWVLLDFTDFVVHVQLSEEREHYGLERLWRDCPMIPLELDEGAAGPEVDVAGAGARSGSAQPVS